MLIVDIEVVDMFGFYRVFKSNLVFFYQFEPLLSNGTNNIYKRNVGFMQTVSNEIW